MCDATRLQVGSRHITTAELLDDETAYEAPETALEWEIDDATDRTISCMRRLVANLLLAMTDQERVQQVGKHASRWTRGPHPSGSPGHRRFMVARPVSTDVRREVQEYCRGGRRGTPSGASLVKGHWKHVPYGPQSASRKLAFIEPYWRAADQAMIVSPRVRVE
jgi:hypothetical protein